MGHADSLQHLVDLRHSVLAPLRGVDLQTATIAVSAALAFVRSEASRAGLTGAAVGDLVRMGEELHADLSNLTNTRGGGAGKPVQDQKSGQFTCDLCNKPIRGAVKSVGKQHACHNCVRKPPTRAAADRESIRVGQPVLWTKHDKLQSKTVKAVVVKVTSEGFKVRTADGKEYRAKTESVRADPAVRAVEKQPRGAGAGGAGGAP